ncbi:arylamine N-acetyltransferase 1 [Plenodomus tracheiphilus IPT5]|uniref:Arylamine N-acetyltransferase 1 n=1 Tax=Plenodomus tracheiphilus IPT5 TaxID=1408161 RepID=A0A6A7B2W4_9PLEO|nr:arylamine N-acetyltransferase 1 [Plenodomus tracheiphilus IPT5]
MTGPRPTYTKAQITQYFARIRLPQSKWQYDVSALNPAAALDYLTTLQTYQLAWVPFENLSLHYSSHRHICLHPEDLFKKIVSDNNGRGGYCMENNCLFATVLRSLGFALYSAGGRVCEGTHWTGWGHMVNLVTIGETKFHVDVGFGADGPIVPMPLDRSGTIQKHISPGSARLDWRNISDNTDPNQRYWVYEYRRNDESDWEGLKYAFTELEFLPQDYAVMSLFTSTSQRTFFTRVVVVERKIMDDNGELVGKLSINGNNMKRRIGADLKEEIDFESEQQRLDALEKHWGIKSGAADREGIRGLASEIR